MVVALLEFLLAAGAVLAALAVAATCVIGLAVWFAGTRDRAAD